MKPPTYDELKERVRALEAFERESAVTTALSELYGPLISSDSTIGRIADAIMEKALALTGSRDGYVTTVDPVTGDNVAHTLMTTPGGAGRIGDDGEGGGVSFSVGEDGRYGLLCGHGLDTGEAFFTNSPSEHAASRGTPEGHIELANFLSVPVMLEKELVGQIALANKKGGYSDYDLETVKRLAEYYSLAIRRLRSESALQESELRYRSTFEQAAVGIANVGLDGRFLKVNQRFCDILGYSADELLSKSFRNVTHPDELNADTRSLERVLSGESPNYTREKRYLSKGGSVVWCNLTVSLLRSEKGKPRYFISVMEDITCRKQMEEELHRAHVELELRVRERTAELLGANERLSREIKERKEAQEQREKLLGQIRENQKLEAIGTLASGIAHDFNNILAVIIGYSELAVLNIPGDHKAFSNVEEVLKAGKRARELIRQILTFSRQGTPERKAMKVGPVVEEVLKLLTATIPKSITISSRIDHDCCAVLADSTQLHQVIMNLCTNAYQAMRLSGGELAVALEPFKVEESTVVFGVEIEAGDYIRLKVSDTGHGMNQRVKDRIFDPYFTTKKKDEGTGLGLSVVHGIVKSHGGHIVLESEPGVGTTFYVFLPCIARLDIPDKSFASGQLPRGNEHILFVDDEIQVVELWKITLETLGYHVTATDSSLEALEIFRENPDRFDLVITDMNMPLMTGAQLAREMMMIKPSVPLVLCTGFSEIIDEPAAKSLGFREFVMKPVVMNELASTIRRVLEDAARH